MAFKDDDTVAQYYLQCIETGGKTINDIDAGPVRKQVKQKVEEIVRNGEANDNQKRSLAKWLATINQTMTGADAEIMTEINSLIEEYKS